MAAENYKALNDSTRRTILDELTERNGQTLFELCGRLAMKQGVFLSRQLVSQHLGVLEGTGVVATERQGLNKYHYLCTSPLAEVWRQWFSPPSQLADREPGEKHAHPSH